MDRTRSFFVASWSRLLSASTGTLAAAVLAAPALAAAPAPPEWIFPDELDHRSPQILRRVDPEYPRMATWLRAEATVVVQGLITREGRVEELRVVDGPVGDIGFHAAALSAIEQWRYLPMVQDGRPAAVELTVTVHFRRRGEAVEPPERTAAARRTAAPPDTVAAAGAVPTALP